MMRKGAVRRFGEPLCLVAVALAFAGDCRELSSSGDSAARTGSLEAQTRLRVSSVPSRRPSPSGKGLSEGLVVPSGVAELRRSAQDGAGRGRPGRAPMPPSTGAWQPGEEDSQEEMLLILRGRLARAKEYYAEGDYSKAAARFRALIRELEAVQQLAEETRPYLVEARDGLRVLDEADELWNARSVGPASGARATVDFRGTPLGEVVSALTMTTGVEITLAAQSSAPLAEIRVSLQAEDCPLEAILLLVQQQHRLKCTTRGNTIVIDRAD